VEYLAPEFASLTSLSLGICYTRNKSGVAFSIQKFIQGITGLFSKKVDSSHTKEWHGLNRYNLKEQQGNNVVEEYAQVHKIAEFPALVVSYYVDTPGTSNFIFLPPLAVTDAFKRPM
jgi:hypothetical protein